MTRDEKIKISREKLREKKYGLSKSLIKWGAVATLAFGGHKMPIVQKLVAADAENKEKSSMLLEMTDKAGQEQLRNSLLHNQELFQQFCEMRSSVLADSLLARARSVQFEIRSKGREVLQRRWGNNESGRVYLGRHCIRSGLEILKEAVGATGNKEFYDGFVRAIEDINPNSCFAAIQAYGKSPNYISCGNLSQRLAEESKNNPKDIFMVVHESRTDTGSGYHFVLVAGGKVVSFNRERISDISEYFRGNSRNPASVINKGHMMNITKEVGRAAVEIQKAAYAACVEEYLKMPQDEKNALLADYMMDTTNSLQNRVLFDPALTPGIRLIDFTNNLKMLPSEKKKLFEAMAVAAAGHKNVGNIVAGARALKIHSLRDSRS